MKLIHYGSKTYNPQLVHSIENRNWCKPRGGLWTSPINSEASWKDWCDIEDFREYNENNCFKLELNSDAKIFIIDSLDDLKNAPLIEPDREYLDFESLARTHDAIWLTKKGLHETHLSYPINLYGWDCETVLIMNPHCVHQTV